MFYVFPRAVPKKECNKILKSCLKNIKFEKASVINRGYGDTIPDGVTDIDPKKSRIDDPVRKTDVGFITEKDNKINELVWYYLREANKIQFNYNLKYFQPVQFARYRNGGHYDWHQDSPGISPHGETRKLSLTFSLTDPKKYEGGDLEFYGGGRKMEDHGKITGNQILKDIRDQGSVVVFDSRDYHRVTPVTKGTRYSIVCWTVGPNFV